jgi:hypothetical protein
MKIILSRKGFDSSAGKQASPIMPDGTLLSLPIPDEEDSNMFSSLQWNGKSYYDIISSLNPRTECNACSKCHLDPDLRIGSKKRQPNWQPAFGQMNAALSHLRNQKVSVGDIFLFFGWFRETVIIDGHLQYKKDGMDAHIIYGYLQIGEIINRKEDVPVFIKDHPHFMYNDAWASNQNAIFLPTNKLSIQPSLNGCDVLDYRRDRVLTKDGMSRRYWDLPVIFKDVTISYNTKSWLNDCFKSAGRGQEFVMDATPQIIEWVKRIIQ